MIISSRTPEGSPNRCPVCASEICIEPSVSLGESACGDAPCPNCGTLLWFILDKAELRSYRADAIESLANRLVYAISARRGISVDELTGEKSFLDDLGLDSLDTAELVMELEEEFDIVLTDELERITTVADAIAFLEAHRRTP